MKNIQLALEYLQSFIECDSTIDHWCSDCGRIEKKDVVINEIEEAIKILNKVVENDTKQTS